MDYSNVMAVRHARSLSLGECHQMIAEYLKRGYTKQEIWEKFIGQKTENGGC